MVCESKKNYGEIPPKLYKYLNLSVKSFRKELTVQSDL